MNTRTRHQRALPSTLTVLLFILAAVALSAGFLGGEVQESRARHSLKVVVITLDEDVELRPVLAEGIHPRSESFKGMMSRLKPHAAINGTFYSKEMLPIGDVLIDGKLRVAGRYPNAIAVRNDGRVAIIRRKGARFDWSGYRHAIAAGPRLVDGGRVKLDPVADGFKLIARDIIAPRSGIGLTRSNKLLLVVCTEPVKLAQFAEMMVELGAVDALNLDGGPACGLHSNGKTLVNAGLPMTNVLIVRKIKS